MKENLKIDYYTKLMIKTRIDKISQIAHLTSAVKRNTICNNTIYNNTMLHVSRLCATLSSRGDTDALHWQRIRIIRAQSRI